LGASPVSPCPKIEPPLANWREWESKNLLPIVSSGKVTSAEQSKRHESSGDDLDHVTPSGRYFPSINEQRTHSLESRKDVSCFLETSGR